MLIKLIINDSNLFYALIVLESMMAREICYNPVIICADSYNKFLTEPKNSAYLLFSDAAIAVSFSNDKSIKILSSDLGTDGTGADKLILEKSGRLITERPEFYIALATMIMGSQFFLAGFLGEIILRNKKIKKQYIITETINE